MLRTHGSRLRLSSRACGPSKEDACARGPRKSTAPRQWCSCDSTTSDCSNPASWAAGGETRLSTSGSFDYTTAAKAGGLFLGDYQGLTSAGSRFIALFDMSKPIATAGRSDTFSNSAA